MAKRALVLFSGGMDSTYLMWQMAEQGLQVDYIYADGAQGSAKSSVEEDSRGDIIDRIKEYWPGWYPHGGGRVLSKVNLSQTPKAKWRQALPWMVAAMEIVDPDVHSSVNIGYCADDDTLQEKYSMIEAWNAMWKFTKKGDVVPLEFPLQLTHKFNMMRDLPPEIYAATWICELPITNARKGATACGRCEPCMTREVEKFRFKLRTHKSLEEHHESIAKRCAELKERNQKEHRTKLEANDASPAKAVAEVRESAEPVERNVGGSGVRMIPIGKATINDSEAKNHIDEVDVMDLAP
jgi:7-cyano-7-deazaguanine synthase in queuosine biosynthesis